MGNWIAFITLGCFCVLASYSVGYDDMRQKTMARMSRIAKPVVLTRVARPGYISPERRAAIIADVFGITQANLDTAANIFGE